MKKTLLLLIPLLLILSGCTEIKPEYQKNTESGTETSGETATFENEMFAFSYPANWRIIEEPSTVRVVSPQTESLAKNIEEEDLYNLKVYLRPNHDQLPPAEFYNGANAVDLYGKAKGGHEEVEIAGIKSVRLIDVAGFYPGDIYIIPFGNKNIEIHYYIVEDQAEEKALKGLLDSFTLKQEPTIEEPEEEEGMSVEVEIQ